MNLERDFGSRLDGKVMGMSVFFDRKIANEDNPALEKLELDKGANLGHNQESRLYDLTP